MKRHEVRPSPVVLHASEVAPNLPEISERAVILTLVHGTFAHDADWSRKHSNFSRSLAIQLPFKIDVRPFLWSGWNSHHARLAASRALDDHVSWVRTTLAPRAHFVIAHSHGGNVAMYSAKDPSLATQLSGIVCMATPFINSATRRSRSAVTYLVSLVFLIVP